jgi:hypothetical protein
MMDGIQGIIIYLPEDGNYRVRLIDSGALLFMYEWELRHLNWFEIIESEKYDK